MLRTLFVSALGVVLLGATLVVGINTNVSSLSGEQEEVDVAMNPTNPAHLVGGSNDAARGFPLCRLYESSNGGQTWTSSQLTLPSGFQYSADPALTFDRNGNAYFAYITYNNSYQLSLYVSKKAAGASSWGAGVLVPNVMADKEFIVTDTDPASTCVDNVYVAWDNNEQSGGQTLRVSRSTNGGQSFQQPPQVSDYVGAAIGANPAVGPGGVVYVAWADWQNHRILFDKSTDCGQTWGTDKVLTSWTLNTGSSLSYKPPAAPNRGAGVFPYLAVDLSSGPRRGRLYAVYNDLSATAGGNSDIFMRYSDNQGTTWSSPVRVNDDTGAGDQIIPRMAVDNTDGSVHVTWYDTRNDSTRRKTEIYYARSVDGQTFLPNEKVSTAQSDKSANTGNGMDYGEYIGIAAARGKAYLFWTDNRSADDEVYGSEVQSVLGINTSSLPKGLVNQAYAATLVGGGGKPPYTWAVTGLPASLSLAASTGQVTGTPTAADVGTFNLNVTLTDAAAASVSRTVTVEVGYPPLAITTTQLAAAGVGQPYSAQLAATGGVGAYSWTATGLPASLGLSSSGLLTGTPVESDAGSRQVTVTVRDSASGTVSRTFTLSIAGSPIAVSPITLAAAQEKVAFGPVQLARTGGTPPFTWSWSPGYAPPGGVVLMPTGILNGTPVRGSAGNHTLKLTLRDASVPTAQTVSTTTPLVIFGPPVANPGESRTVDPGLQTLDGSQSNDPAGNALQHTWTAPAGVTLSDPAAAQPTVALKKAAEYSFVLEVKTSAGAASEPQAVKLTVRNLPPTVSIQPVQPVDVGATVTLDASATADPNEDSIALYWFQVSGPTTRLSTLSGPQTSFAPAEPGTYVFQASASDGTSTTTANVEVRVNAAAEPPKGCGCGATGLPNAAFLVVVAALRRLRRRQ